MGRKKIAIARIADERNRQVIMVPHNTHTININPHVVCVFG